MTPTRWACRTTAPSWLTSTSVSPRSRHSFASRSMISSLVSSSRLPVGSSASTTRGSLTRARAIATRCCWPPDSSDGRWRDRSASPTLSSAAAARRRRSADPMRSGTSAASTFSAADSVGTRLNVWKTNPMARARSRVSSASPIRPRSRPSSLSCPEVGRSRPPSRFSSVDLPCPVRPRMATHSPSATVRPTSQTARTVRDPLR
jgi:hypothetical protein